LADDVKENGRALFAKGCWVGCISYYGLAHRLAKGAHGAPLLKSSSQVILALMHNQRERLENPLIFQ